MHINMKPSILSSESGMHYNTTGKQNQGLTTNEHLTTDNFEVIEEKELQEMEKEEMKGRVGRGDRLNLKDEIMMGPLDKYMKYSKTQ